VYCQLEALRHCLPPSVRGILDEMPETLDETYARVLNGINKANREHARRLLQCLTVALQPLRVEELAEVLAIDFDAPAYGGIPQLNSSWRWTDQHQAVLSTCSSLIAIVDYKGSKIVQFSHFSVKEYLTSDRLAHSSGDVSCYHIPLESAHTTFAQACLSVLLHLDADHLSAHIPLILYSGRYWFDHARFGNVSSRIQDAMEYFFDADKPHWTAWYLVQTTDLWDSWQSYAYDAFQEPRAALPLYYASFGGFYDLVEHLIAKHPEQINAKGGRNVTPLWAALRKKHFQVAELLHRNGADINFRDHDLSTLLCIACQEGRLDAVQWLFNHGADINVRREGLRTPVHIAATNRRPQVLKMLIEHNADIHVRSIFGYSPLHLAASSTVPERDHVDVMQVLLDHGADPNALDDDNSTPLHHSSWWQNGNIASRKGTVEGTRLLLKYGAIIDAEDNKGRTPLQLALEHGRHDMVACLKEHGATR
jgi:ankyrin repeat protein